MKILVVALSTFLMSCTAHSKNQMDDYHPEDDVMIDSAGKIKIIEESQLSDRQETEIKPKQRYCLSLRMDENDNMIYDVKKCYTDF